MKPAGIFLVAVLAWSVATAHAQPADMVSQLPAGTYTLDKAHASLNFRVDHLGFSNYTGGFRRFDATLELDPANPASASLTATIDVSSLTIPAPPPGFIRTLLGADWFNTAAHPEMTFRSTSVTPTGDTTARVEGELEMLGVTQPVTLNVTFNGGYPNAPGFDPRARIGFSAVGSLTRSGFGLTASLPPPNSTMGVSDAVEILIEAEFSGPEMTGGQ